nr:MAG TPA: hypothetical protein [Caudoviricetes sp.]
MGKKSFRGFQHMARFYMNNFIYSYLQPCPPRYKTLQPFP